jgi:hypothetical protein
VAVQTLDPPHPAAAQVFLNWYASARGQEVYDQVMLESSARTDVDLPAELGYVGIQDGVDYCDDSNLDWYLKERGDDTETLVGYAG